MLVGSARVSSPGQDVGMQKGVIVVAGCKRVYTDVESGVKGARLGFARSWKMEERYYDDKA